jgi:hypothetical protein
MTPYHSEGQKYKKFQDKVTQFQGAHIMVEGIFSQVYLEMNIMLSFQFTI